MRTFMEEMLQVLEASIERVVEEIQAERVILDGFSSMRYSLSGALFGDLLTAKMGLLDQCHNGELECLIHSSFSYPTTHGWVVVY